MLWLVLLKGCKPRLLERITEGERRKGNGREEIVVWREEMGNETGFKQQDLVLPLWWKEKEREDVERKSQHKCRGPGGMGNLVGARWGGVFGMHVKCFKSTAKSWGRERKKKKQKKKKTWLV